MQPNAVIRFTTKWPPNVGSLLVATGAGSRLFSHSMLLIGGTAYEAVMSQGCRAVPISVAMGGVIKYQDMPVFLPNLLGAIRFGEKHAKARTPYDFAGAIGIPFLHSEDWEDDTKYWCSEHNFAMAMEGGLNMLDPEVIKRVTPEHLRQCNYKKSPVLTWT